MTIPSQLAYLFGAGIALLILERVFTFIKWILTRNYGLKREHLVGNPHSLSDRQILESLLTKTETTTAAMGGLAVDMGKVKTKVDFIREIQREQNGSVKKLHEAFDGQAKTCNKRFGKLERKK